LRVTRLIAMTESDFLCGNEFSLIIVARED
jgi:hypothetical protein